MKALLTALFAGALLSSTAQAAQKSISLLVKADPETFLPSDVPGYNSHRKIGDYVKINVDAEHKDIALALMTSQGYDVSEDVTYTRRHRPSETASPMVSAQSLTFNDPRLVDQTELTTTINEISEAMEGIREVRNKPTVMILDTGAVPHEDIVVTGGYSVTTRFGQQPNPDYTDKTTLAPGNECSSGHGNQMLGVVGAEQNNGVGISGIVDAELYMIRAVSTDCNTGEDEGSLIDLYEGLLVASGETNVLNAPAPDVVLMSLAAESPCPTYLVDTIKALNAQGTSVIVSSGNAGGNTASYAPANCPGVIVVGAHEDDGTPSSYSNIGNHVDVAVEGSRLTTDGSGYVRVSGTSLSAAAAAGVVALLKSNFPDATFEQIEWVLRGSATAYADGYCDYGCGAGRLDANAALGLSEQLIDPNFNFVHASDDSCQDTRKIEALSPYIDMCNALVAKVDLPYAGGVAYDIKLMKRERGATSWSGERTTEIARHAPGARQVELPLLDVDFDEFDYAAVACDDAGNCPFVSPIVQSSIVYPPNCE